MNNAIIQEILRQISNDERFFGEGFIDSWNDFSAFKRAYQDEEWDNEAEETLKVLFYLMRRGKKISI